MRAPKISDELRIQFRSQPFRITSKFEPLLRFCHVPAGDGTEQYVTLIAEVAFLAQQLCLKSFEFVVVVSPAVEWPRGGSIVFCGGY